MHALPQVVSSVRLRKVKVILALVQVPEIKGTGDKGASRGYG